MSTDTCRELVVDRASHRWHGLLHLVNPNGSPARSAGGRRLRWVLPEVLLPFLATRLALLIAGLVALRLVPRLSPGAWGNPSRHEWINIWTRWDGEWYLGIAREGYSFQPEAGSPTSYAPLYPLLMRLGAALFGRSDDESLLVAGIVIANLALVIAAAALNLLVRLDFDQATARRATLYLMVFPTTLFLSAVYPESLFLALALLALYSARTGRWWLAGLLAALATLSRPHGALLVLPLAVEYVLQFRFRPRLNAMALAFVPLSLGGWMVYLQWLRGNALAFAAFNQPKPTSLPVVWPWQTFQHFMDGPLVLHGIDHSLLDLSFTVALLALVAMSWSIVRPSYSLYATAQSLLLVSLWVLGSLMRYMLEVFPLFLVLARAGERQWFHRAFVALSGSLAILFMMMFAVGFWLA